METLRAADGVDVGYKQYKECPAISTVVPSGVTPADNQAAIVTAFENHIYGPGKPIELDTITYTAGKAVVKVNATTSFTYVITEVRNAGCKLLSPPFPPPPPCRRPCQLPLSCGKQPAAACLRSANDYAPILGPPRLLLFSKSADARSCYGH